MLRVLLLMLLMITNSIEAGVEYQEREKIKISENGINRLSFAPQRVEKIFGDTAQFSAKEGNGGSDLFLTSALSAGTKIDISVVLSNNEVRDLEMKVTKDNSPKVIKFKTNRKVSQIDSKEGEAERMLRAMRSGKQDKYYTEDMKVSIPVGIMDYTQIRGYRYNEMFGAVIEVTNNTKQEYSIDPYKTADSFKNVVKVATPNRLVFPEEKQYVYIIFKRENSISQKEEKNLQRLSSLIKQHHTLQLEKTSNLQRRNYA